jgi:hypothetical protein
MTIIHVESKNSDLHIVNDSPSNRTNVVVHTKDDRRTLKLRRHSKHTLEDDVTAYGGIYFERSDNQGVWTNGMILGGEDYLLFASSKDGILDDPSVTLTFRNGKLGIGNTIPKYELDIIGSINVTNNIYGNLCIPTYTQEQIDNLQPSDGMLVLSSKHGLILFLAGHWTKIQLGEKL